MVSTASLEDKEPQQTGSVELWNLSEHVLVSDVLRQALFGAAKFGMRQGITIPQEDPKSPFLMASSPFSSTTQGVAFSMLDLDG